VSILEDKLGELTTNKAVFGFNIFNKDGEFTIEVHLRGREDWPTFHKIEIGPKSNLHQVVDEAIEVLREHLSDCSLC